MGPHPCNTRARDPADKGSALQTACHNAASVILCHQPQGGQQRKHETSMGRWSTWSLELTRFLFCEKFLQMMDCPCCQLASRSEWIVVYQLAISRYYGCLLLFWVFVFLPIRMHDRCSWCPFQIPLTRPECLSSRYCDLLSPPEDCHLTKRYLGNFAVPPTGLWPMTD